MSIVIAILGEPSEKIVDGERQKVIPFVGTDSEGEFAKMGIGLILPEKWNVSIWGLVMPHALIRSWRGMKLLEQVECIEHGTLCACWAVATRNMHESDYRHLDVLADQFGGLDKLEKAREVVLTSVPSVDEIQSMITTLRKKNVGVDSWDLTVEIEAGLITTSPLIETIIREEEERQAAYTKKEDEIKKPVPPEESLSKFFEDLGIGNFIVSGDFGGFGMDCGHIKLSEIDEIVKRDSLSGYLTKGFMLDHKTQGSETFAAGVTPSTTMNQTSYGEIEKPWYLAANGTKYTFLSAQFRNERFYIKTRIETDEEPPTESEFAVSNLREMIGSTQMSQPPTLIQRLVSRVRSLFD